jgi:hypothetical protein
MFDCRRCNNTGKITEQYVEKTLPIYPVIFKMPQPEVEIKTRVVECPECLGFSVLSLRRRPWPWGR